MLTLKLKLTFFQVALNLISIILKHLCKMQHAFSRTILFLVTSLLERITIFFHITLGDKLLLLCFTHSYLVNMPVKFSVICLKQWHCVKDVVIVSLACFQIFTSTFSHLIHVFILSDHCKRFQLNFLSMEITDAVPSLSNLNKLSCWQLNKFCCLL